MSLRHCLEVNGEARKDSSEYSLLLLPPPARGDAHHVQFTILHLGADRLFFKKVGDIAMKLY